ncbi:MAG: hypothetical protein FWD42_06485 [Solirubrobacterales bacterium]|nr:hypothetical protein [Solirubrobacterales bacterium]
MYLDHQLDVVVEPTRAVGGRDAPQRNREPPGDDTRDVLLAGNLGQLRADRRSRILEQHLCEVLAHPGDLALGEWRDVHAMARPVSACAVAGSVVYRVEPVST